MNGLDPRALALHLGVLAALLAGNWLLPEYHHGNVARIMVLAVHAIGFNIAFGYAGLLSLGHALFFAAGMYGFGLAALHGGAGFVPSLLAGILVTLAVTAPVGALALRTGGVAFMIVTLMFAQAGWLTILWAGAWTRGDEGFVIPAAARTLAGVALGGAEARYLAALALFAPALLASLWLAASPFGRVLVAIRENESRARMLGFETTAAKFRALLVSGLLCGLSGALYAALFGYAGASFAATQNSILPLLHTLLGGPGTVLGPVVGTALMFHLIDLGSALTDAYLLIVGVVLLLLTLFLRAGLLGTLRDRLMPWLP